MRPLAEFVLDFDRRQLLRGGRQVRLSPHALDLLSILIMRRPDVTTKRDLLTAIWPDSVVVEANLTVVIAELRRALGDERHAPRFIRTVHGVGYAFCGHAVAAAGRDAVSCLELSPIRLAPGRLEEAARGLIKPPRSSKDLGRPKATKPRTALGRGER